MYKANDINTETLSHIPGFSVWKKDAQGNFLDMNECFARTLGFHKPADAYGKSDYDLPTGMSKFADIFRAADKKVMAQQRPFKFLEIQPCSNEEWKAFYVIKAPLKENNDIIGTLGLAMDVTHMFAVYNDYIRLASINHSLPTPSFKKDSTNKLILSNRQIECLALLNVGKTVKEIGKILELSPRTVEDYLNNIKQKLGCRNLRQLIKKTIELENTPTYSLNLLHRQLSITIDD